MSKLLDKLDRIGRGRPTSLGFGSASRGEKLPAMTVVGVLTDRKSYSKQAAILADAGADAVLLEGATPGKALTDLAKKLDTIPWGPKVSELGVDEASGFRDAGCDFLAFGPEKALLGAMEGENTGYFLCVDPDLEERFLRSIEDLSVDGVLLPSSSVSLPLTVQHMMTLGVVREAFSKYLFLELPGPLSVKELEGLRDMGIDGVVVNPSVFSKEDIQEMISSLKSLPKKQQSRSRRPDAILPKQGMGFVAGPDLDDDDDDDDD
jgi:hypothetical protein